MVNSLVAQDFLEPTVVTASRMEQQQLESPHSITIITEDEILKEQLRTIPEALQATSGVLVQKTTHGHGSPFVRGFTGRQNLLLVDGVRMNDPTWRNGPVQYWNTLDIYSVSQMELIKGPSSVMFGSDSLGGTLNVLSKGTGYDRPTSKGHSGFYQDGSVFYRFDTNSESHVGRIEQRIGELGKWGFSLGLGVKSYGDIRDSFFGQMNRTGYSEENFDLKYQYALSDRTELTLAHQYLNQDDIWRWHSTKYSERGGAGLSWIHGDHVTQAGDLDYRIYDQERFLTYVRISGSEAGGLLENWSSTFSYQKSQDSERRSDLRWGVSGVQTFGWGFQASGDLGPGVFVWGGDYYYNEVDSDGSELKRRPVADDSAYDSLGAFAQYHWDIVENFNLELGARSSYFDAEWGDYANGEADGDDWSDLSCSARGTYEVTRDAVVYGGVSQGFRAPNLHDITGSGVALSGTEEFGSSDLDPEKVVSFELGTKADVNGVIWSLAAFYTDIEDPITRINETVGVDTVARITNGEEGYIWGVEADAAWQISEQWDLFGNLTFQDGKEKSRKDVGGPVTEDTVSRLSPLVGSVTLRWTQTGDKVWVEGQLLGAATQNNLSQRDLGDDQRVPANGTPGYMTGSLRGSWHAKDNVLVTLGLENLTDEDYRVHGSGVNGAGFNAILGLKLDW